MLWIHVDLRLISKIIHQHEDFFLWIKADLLYPMLSAYDLSHLYKTSREIAKSKLK